jgi:hypothetical protein
VYKVELEQTPHSILLWEELFAIDRIENVAAVTFLPSRCLPTIGEYKYRHRAFMNYSVETGSGAMIYTPNFTMTGTGIRDTHRDSMVIA